MCAFFVCVYFHMFGSHHMLMIIKQKFMQLLCWFSRNWTRLHHSYANLSFFICSHFKLDMHKEFNHLHHRCMHLKHLPFVKIDFKWPHIDNTNKCKIHEIRHIHISSINAVIEQEKMMRNKRKSFAQVQRIGKYTYGNVHCVVLCQDYFEHPTSVGLLISNLFVEIDCVLSKRLQVFYSSYAINDRVYLLCVILQKKYIFKKNV